MKKKLLALMLILALLLTMTAPALAAEGWVSVTNRPQCDTLELTLTDTQDGTLVVAAYQDGRMMGVGTAAVTAGQPTAEVTLSRQLSQDWTYKAFLLSADYVPLKPAITLELPEYSTQSLVYKQEGNAYTVTGVGDETEIVIPAQHEGLPVTKLQGDYGTGAFARKNITSVTIPDSVVEIGQNTFHNCSELASVNISETSNLTTIGNNAFSGCGKLTALYRPAGVNTLGDSVFNNCGSIDAFTVAQGNTAYKAENGHLIEIATGKLIRGANDPDIPDGVREIEAAAFRRANITELNIPASVTKLGNYFCSDSTIQTIHYAGTEAQWAAALPENKYWSPAKDGITVLCAQPSEGTRVKVTANGQTLYAVVPNTVTGRAFLEMLPFEISGYRSDVDVCCSVSGSIANDPSENEPWVVGTIGWFGGWFTVLCEEFGNMPVPIIAKFEDEYLDAVRNFSGNIHFKVEHIDAGETPGEDQPTPPTPVDPGPDSDSRVLVAYFSTTNNTKGIAEKLQTASGADIFAIQAAVPYTDADRNYNDSTSRTQVENRNSAARPAITQTVSNIGDYDVVFLGYPIWNGNAPKVIYTFLESVEGWNNQTIVPFCTSGSSPIGSSATNLHALITNTVTWESGNRFAANADQSTVTSWAESLNVLPKPEPATNKLNVSFNGHSYTATLAENSSVDAFVTYLKEQGGSITINAVDYGGFEKVGGLGTSIVQNNTQITTVPGDIILYQGNSIVLYYAQNSWSFTRLGKLDGDLSNLKSDLGSGNVSITYSLPN